METPGSAFPLGSVALAVLSVDALLRRLPAETRAVVASAQKPLWDALLELRKGELTDEVVQAAMQTIARAFWESFAQNRDEWRAAVAAELQQDRQKLDRFVEDDDTCDTIAWLSGFLERPRRLSRVPAVPHRQPRAHGGARCGRCRTRPR